MPGTGGSVTQGSGHAPRRARFDLHMHSLASDGRLSAEALLLACARGGLDVVSITDHDLPPTLPAGWCWRAGRWIRLIHGVELSGLHRDQEHHLLVYFPGEMPESFRGFVRERAIARARRYDRVAASLELPRSVWADQAAYRGERALTRHHLAQALVTSGLVPNFKSAFTHYLAFRHGHVPRVDISLVELIDASRAAGGLCSWAHPPLAWAREWLDELVSAGLQGIEVTRPSLGTRGRGVLGRMAHRHRLVVTGGSDWHGWQGGQIGNFTFPLREARPFVRALGLSWQVPSRSAAH